MAALRNSISPFDTRDKAEWQSKIEKIDNKADRSFLYLQLAPYFPKRGDKELFFKKGIELAESVSSTYDKVNRLDMSINECK